LKARLGLALLLGLGGCMPSVEPPKPGPHFDPFVFFAGDSRGEASLRKLFSSPEPIHVRSHGQIESGTLVLAQTIAEGDTPPRDRVWHIRAVGPDRFAGTLSDAAGPVSGEVEGNRLHLAFAMKGGVAADQWLTLAPDGRSAHNILVARKFGLVVAVLDETIRRGS